MEVKTPGDVIELDPEFADAYHDAAIAGMTLARSSKVLVTGLARNIANIAPLTMKRLEGLSKLFKEFQVHVVENDSTDGTPDLIREWQPGFKVTLDSSTLDRPHLPASREAERTIALAEYRQRGVRFAESLDIEYVIVLDWDAWGGFLNEGVLTSLHYLSNNNNKGIFERDGYFAMASIGLAQFPGSDNWFNYDAWAHRPLWSWRQRPEMWYHHFVPPFGCPPIEVNSAFGGLCVYHVDDFITGQYSGRHLGSGDCEHVAFHRSIAKATGKSMALNPSSVGLMFWNLDEDSECSTQTANAA